MSAGTVPEPVTASTEEIAQTKEEIKAVMNAIENYPDPGGEILRLRLIGGLSFKQIGKIMNHTETWARVNYYRAKQTIVKELGIYEE